MRWAISDQYLSQRQSAAAIAYYATNEKIAQMSIAPHLLHIQCLIDVLALNTALVITPC